MTDLRLEAMARAYRDTESYLKTRMQTDHSLSVMYIKQDEDTGCIERTELFNSLCHIHCFEFISERCMAAALKASGLKATIDKLVTALDEATDDIEAQVNQDYPPGSLRRPTTKRRYDRDMEQVTTNRALVKAVMGARPVTEDERDSLKSALLDSTETVYNPIIPSKESP